MSYPRIIHRVIHSSLLSAFWTPKTTCGQVGARILRYQNESFFQEQKLSVVGLDWRAAAAALLFGQFF